MSTIKPEAGEMFYQFINRVKDEIVIEGRYRYKDCEFNGIHFHISDNSNLSDIATIYDLKCTIRRIKEGKE